MVNKEKMDVIIKIVERADEMGLLMFDRLSLLMDMEIAAEQFDLRLDELLLANPFDFSHDIVGIENNINRETKIVENIFLPRYAGSTEA